MARIAIPLCQTLDAHRRGEDGPPAAGRAVVAVFGFALQSAARRLGQLATVAMLLIIAVPAWGDPAPVISLAAHAGGGPYYSASSGRLPSPVPRARALLVADANGHSRPPGTASAGPIAVVYPDLGEPYRSVFATIIEGIQEQVRLPIHAYPVGPNSDQINLGALVKRDDVKVVIALGRQGLKAASELDADMPVVVGGVLAVPDMENHGALSISLTPDPALLFARLRSLLPSVKRVFVVYNPRNNDWLIKLARDAAKAQGLQLVAYEAHDLATAVRIYQNAFATCDGRHDAVWLPQDATTVDETTILPLVLREAWSRSVPVFSSSFLHVKKGALFALYPNNLELGKTLAASAQRIASGDLRRHGVVPLHDVQTAINLRTASHIGLNIGYQQQRNFDFIFPEP